MTKDVQFGCKRREPFRDVLNDSCVFQRHADLCRNWSRGLHPIIEVLTEQCAESPESAANKPEALTNSRESPEQQPSSPEGPASGEFAEIDDADRLLTDFAEGDDLDEIPALLLDNIKPEPEDNSN